MSGVSRFKFLEAPLVAPRRRRVHNGAWLRQGDKEEAGGPIR